MQAGFKAVWASETSASQARMFENLTGAKCLGDTFGEQVWSAKRVGCIKSDQSCPDYSRSGSQLGGQGESGWMFIKQVDILLQLRPWAICLEIPDNAVNVNEGKEVAEVTVALEVAYVVHARLIQVRKYGDPSNRTRLFMVALHRDLGHAAYDFQWPTESSYS